MQAQQFGRRTGAARGQQEDLVERLMGRKPEARFQFIQENAEFAVGELDI